MKKKGFSLKCGPVQETRSQLTRSSTSKQTKQGLKLLQVVGLRTERSGGRERTSAKANAERRARHEAVGLAANSVAMASIAAAVAVPTFTGLKAETRAAPAAQVSSNTVVRMAPVSASLQNVGKALFAASTSILLASSANAATVKMGGDGGELGFFPSSITVASGEAITFINNKGFPHNVVFDEDAVPEGVKADDLGHADYANAPDEKFNITLTKPGTYEFYCEPHQGAGMKGVITVS